MNKIQPAILETSLQAKQERETDDIDPPQFAYLHIPFCRRRCYYCDFPIAVLGNKTPIDTSVAIADYVEALRQEIENTPNCTKKLKTVFFGGGTPSLLPVRALESILTTLSQRFGIATDAEISMEIDPGTFSLEQLQAYLSAGVNRISLGVQAFQDELLQLCGRSHSLSQIFDAIDLTRQAGVNNLSIDLISGLPRQNIEQWQQSLENAIAIAPQHLSCYDLVLEPVTAFGKQYQPGETPLPSDETTAQMYRLSQQMLAKAGYQHYEISNYAKSGFQCRHNRAYWENRAFYGFGMGAASYLNHQRYTRPRTRVEYYAWVRQLRENKGAIDCPVSTHGDRLLETLMLGLRLADGIDLSALSQQFGKGVLEEIWTCLQPYAHQGWVEFLSEGDRGAKPEAYRPLAFNDRNLLSQCQRLRLSDPEGFLFSNTILATLFNRLSED
jgi:putative oxygen-independent coproporphyrinogen III oxidase